MRRSLLLALTGVLTKPPIRAVVALAVAAVSFIGVRQVSYECLPPFTAHMVYWQETETIRFMLLNVVFLMAALWLLFEILRPYASKFALSGISQTALALALACGVYAVISLALSLSVELSGFTSDAMPTRVLFWFFPNLVLLWHTGAFSSVPCGY
jgi:hypothetical protein